MISVCIATYNGGKYIQDQIRSIITQLSPEDEIIISDDGSTDNTIEKIQELNVSKIKIIYNYQTHGYTSNFENAIRAAKGEYIFLADQDDVWMPTKVKVCMETLKKYDLVVSDAKITDSNMNIIFSSFYEQRGNYRSLIGNLLKFGYLGCCLAFRSSILHMALPFPSNHRLCTHDNWLFLIGKTFYHSCILDKPLIYYRRHKNTTSTGHNPGHNSIGFMLRYRLYLIWNLICRTWRRNKQLNQFQNRNT